MIEDDKNIARFDRLLETLLGKGDGVFLGEWHDQPSVKQVLQQLLPALKKAGVGTISLEETQSCVDLVHIKQDYASYRTWCTNNDKVPLSKYQHKLISSAKELDFVVLGHESSKMEEAIERTLRFIRNASHMDSTRRVNLVNNTAQAVYKNDITLNGVNNRNKEAALYIKKFAKGKIIILGGEAHSGNYTKADALAADGQEGRIGLPKGQEGDYRGLDRLMNFPSIDFVKTKKSIQAGVTEISDGKFQDFIVRLPSNLEQTPLAKDFGLNFNSIEIPKLPIAPENAKLKR